MICFKRLASAIIVFIALSASVQAQNEKLRVNDPAVAARLLARGGKLVADYGSFKIIEADAAAVAGESNRVESAEAGNFIELHAVHLDTRTPATKSLRKARGTFRGERLHLIQFAAPVKPEWRAALEGTGVKIVSYIPQNAYLVYGDAAALAQAQTWAATNPVVQWEGAYNDDWKINPAARATNALGQARWPGTATFAIQLVDDPAANSNTLAQVDALKLAPVERESRALGYLNLFVELPPERVAELATNADVVSIQPYFPRQKFCERQDQIMAGNLSGNVPSGPGYLAWLAGKGFTQAQFDASGLVVDVSDSGIDNGTTSPGHFALYKQGNPTGGSRVVYNRVEGTANFGSTKAGCDGHGNLNTHIIAGYTAMAAGFPHTDSGGFQYGLGVCPFVKVGSSVIFDPNNFTDPNYANLQSKAYNDGARISGNSWGGDTAGAYDADAQAYDALVRDAQPAGSTFATAGNQQMVIVFAAGNAGPNTQTVGSPGTAKNVIVVGAAENVRSQSIANGGRDAAGNDGCSTPDSIADSAADISDFSSRGPCADGRFKPDLVAPGTHITGGVGQSVLTTNGNGTAISCFTGEGVCALTNSGTAGSTNNFFPLGQQFYTSSSGTSHATPAVAGACALLRQYFINANLAPPSPAMTKAFLMNSARYLTGTYANDTLPSPTQGMGSVNLGIAFDGVGRVLRDQAGADKFTASGQTRTTTGNVADGSKPFRVTLAWTDAPGSTTGNAYNNNLDLTVTVGGNTYKGNVFSGANSVTGGAADAKNNVESVFLPAGVTGPFVVTVTAANINSDGVPNEAPALDQDFALVIYNGAASPLINGQPSNQTNVAGGSAAFSVVVTGTSPLSYQWFFNNALLANATNSSLLFASLDPTNAGDYFVVVTNSFGGATSSVATLAVTLAPVIVQSPLSQSILIGQPANFTAAALGAPPLAYQWRKNGNGIAGANVTNYFIASVTAGDAGNYDIVVTNLSGSITSSVAVLTALNPAAYNGVLAGWDMLGQSSYGASPMAATTNAPNVTVTGLKRGGGFTTVNTSAANAWGGNGLNSATATAAIAAGDFATFSLTASAGYFVSVSNVSRFDYRRSGTSAPTGGLLQYSYDGLSFTDAATLAFPSTASGGASLATIDLSATAGLQNIPPGTNVTFRLVLYGGTSSTANWYIYNRPSTTHSNEFEISGSLAPVVVVTPPPVITVPPSPTNVFAGNNAGFRVTATGSGTLNYQWLKGSVPLTNGDAIYGAQTNALNFIPAATYHTGGYWVIVTNLGGGVTSSVALLNVVPVPALMLTNSAGGLVIGAENGAVNNRFIVQLATNLVSPVVWVPIQTNVIGTNAQIHFTETNSTAPFRFYRLLFP